MPHEGAYTSCHVFAVLPSLDTGWHASVAANAGTGATEAEQTAHVVPLDQMTADSQRKLYPFYAITGDE